MSRVTSNRRSIVVARDFAPLRPLGVVGGSVGGWVPIICDQHPADESLMPTEELRTRELPPEAVRLLTLATLLLGDASFISGCTAAYAHATRASEMLSLPAVIIFAVGLVAYVVAVAWGAVSAKRGAAMLVVLEARRGHIPGLTDLDCLNYLRGKPIGAMGTALPPNLRGNPHRAAGVDDVVARDSERALGMLCAHHSAAAFAAYQAAVRQHALRTYRLEHSLPLFRLMVFGWQPSVLPWDFARVLRATLVWGGFVGAPTAMVGILAVATQPQTDGILVASCLVCIMSLLLGLILFATGFPATLLTLAQRDASRLESVIDAEFNAASRERELEQQLELRVQAALASSKGGVKQVLPKVKRLEVSVLDEKLRYVSELAANPALAA